MIEEDEEEDDDVLGPVCQWRSCSQRHVLQDVLSARSSPIGLCVPGTAS